MAVDVCDLCYGDLCRSCALPLKGRKDRVCKDCALTVSGVRGNGKPEIRGDRRTVKSRRKEYAAIEKPEDFFRYFDADRPAGAGAAANPPPPASRSDREKAASAESGSTSSAEDGGSASAGDGTGIRRLLGRLKPNEPDPADDELVAIDEILTETVSKPDENETGRPRDADAVSQLADIRRRDRNRPDGGEPPPPGGSDAIPSTLLQGFRDGQGRPDDSITPTGTAGLSNNAIPRGAMSHPQQDPSVRQAAEQVVDGRLLTEDRPSAGPDPEEATTPADDRLQPTGDPFAQPGDDGPAFQTERRRTLHPVEDLPDGEDEAGLSSPRQIGQLTGIPEVSPALRELMADVSGQPPSTSPAENPFLKRSRVVSEPDAAPDFSTDPFSADEPVSQAPPADNAVVTSPVPAPVSPSSSAPIGVTEPAEPPSPESPTQSDPDRESAGGEEVGIEGPEELEPQVDPVAAPPPPQAGPSEPGPSEPGPSEQGPSEPDASSGTEPPSRSRVAAYTPVERHPLAAFADSDRHPLAAFARHAAPKPPTTPQPTSALQPPPNPQPPTIDDVFPDEPASPEADRTIGRPSATEDVPPIDDLLPPEPAETEEPPEPTEPDLSSGPTETWQPWEPTQKEEPTEAEEPAEADPETSWETWEPTHTDETADAEPESSWETWQPPEADQPTHTDKPTDAVTESSWETWQPPEADEPTHTDEPTDAEPETPWETWQPTEVDEPTDTGEPTDTDEPTETDEATEAVTDASWETWQPPEASDSWESWEPSGADESSDEPSEISTLDSTPEDDSAVWTMADDVADDDAATPQQRPDRDARGSWIPPALRGIAPDAKEAAEDLPRRRG